jgi:hypothetical protein
MNNGSKTMASHNRTIRACGWIGVFAMAASLAGCGGPPPPVTTQTERTTTTTTAMPDMPPAAQSTTTTTTHTQAPGD